jgi:hypothetical protein
MEIFNFLIFAIAIFIFLPMLSPRFWSNFIANQRLRKVQKALVHMENHAEEE